MMKYTQKTVSNRESGMALVFAIGLLALLLMIGMAFVGNAVNYRKVAENNSARSQSRMFALSAVSRAATSLLIYAHQYARDPEKNNEFPRSFDGIYSYAAYNNNGEPVSGGTEYNDGLRGSASLMRVPSSDDIDVLTAMKFNQQFAKDWPGKWVFFTNGQSGSDRRIIGRAAWQVIGSPAQLLAPVFMRGHIELDADNPGFVTNEERWGRDIDEVYLGELSGSTWTVPADSIFAGVYPRIKDDSSKLNDYEAIYSTAGTQGGNRDVQRWMEKWFIPDFEEEATISDPSAFADEKFSDAEGVSLARFNISELSGGTDWHNSEEYKGISNLITDQWYARFGIKSSESEKLNSEESIKLLTKDYTAYSSDHDSVFAADGDTVGLTFLRRIGTDKGTFEDLGTLRKQIAANFNDYCDEDGIPTADIAAGKWLELIGQANSGTDAGGNTKFNHPAYTGNEKTPYIYELGMNLGFVSSDKTQNTISAKKDAVTGKYRIGMAVKAAPIMKLVNIYPFDPAGKNVHKNEFYKDFASGDFMRGYVDFGKIEFGFKINEAVLKDVEFSYDVTVQKYKEVDDGAGGKTWEKDGDPETVTKTLKVDITLNSDFIGAAYDRPGVSSLSSTYNFTGDKWERFGAAGSGGETTIEPVTFSGDDVKNENGSKPYPVKFTAAKDDKMWQMLGCSTAVDGSSPLDFALMPVKEDLFEITGSGAGGTVVDKNGMTFGSESGDGVLNDFKDDFKKACLNKVEESVNGAEKTETTYSNCVVKQPESVDVEKIEISALQIHEIRRAVLTANVEGTEVGVDYVRTLPALAGLNTAFAGLTDKVFSVNSGVDGSVPVPGLVIGSYRNLDPRQNLNAGDWIASTAVVRVDNFVDPDKSSLASVMKIDPSGNGLVNTPAVADSNVWIPKNYDDAEGAGIDAKANMDWERAGEPGYLGPAQDRHISTAVIRNAPMMSPWEIGFIHRGVKWQTINLKKSYKINEFLDDNGDKWDNTGCSYGNGDAAILEQIKMTDRSASYGKINVNMLRKNAPNFEVEYDKWMIQALFQNLRYNEDPAIFIKYSTRDSDGKFLDLDAADEPYHGTVIDGNYFSGSDSIIDNMLRDESRPQFGNKLSFLNYSDPDSLALDCAFSKTVMDAQITDAAQEEIIGKTINLINARTDSPRVIKMIVVAQSIRDNAGDQIRMTDETSGFTNLNGATIDTDGLATKSCNYGKFDFVEHDTDHGKNIYFDDITGEVKMYVKLSITPEGRMTINKIHYY